jgi:two-component system, NtrC family, sensor kinase
MTETTTVEPMEAEAPMLIPATAVGRRSFTLSVRTKGLIVFGALIIYAFVIAVFVFHQKDLLFHEFEDIQHSLELDSRLKQADSAAFHAVMAVFANIDAPDRVAGMQRVQMHLQVLRDRHAELEASTQLGLSLVGVNSALAEAKREPTKPNMNQLVVELVKVKNEFTNLAEQSELARKRMSDRYKAQADSVAMTAMLLAMLGLALLGAITGLFFRQLTEDLHTLRTRALAIVNGYRGEPIPIRRHDEVGQLIMAVNSMADVLDQREKELILERQKYFHQEKMAAIGALAAGVAHEIGNPIAAISGIAQEMVEHRDEVGGVCGEEDCRNCRPDLIHEHTQRLAAITREIAEFASPQAAEPQWLDLNARLRSTASLIRYDRRVQRVDLQLDLDSQLPAIYGVADHLTQVIMNLLINAMDALEDSTNEPKAIVVSTRRIDKQAGGHDDGRADSRVELRVKDNGHGMSKDILDHAFDAFFTTKPAGKGTGLGLSLCYSIMRTHGGSIEIESEPGAGTTVHVFFPLTDTAYKEVKSL